MAYDFFVMSAVKGELQKLLRGAQVQRVSQPSREEITLSIYREGKEDHLLLSCHPQRARVHLTGERPRRTGEPPPFCMLLRKYLLGTRLLAISQPPLERVLKFQFTAPVGLPATTLIAEIMGRRSNLLLVDDQEIILGAVQTATLEQNPRRAVLPGLRYKEVPAQQKLDPLTLTAGELEQAVHPLLARGERPERALLKAVAGLSPLWARELIHRSNWDREAPQGSLQRLHDELRALFSDLERAPEPILYAPLKVCSPYPLKHLQESGGERFSGMNEMLDYYYKDLAERAEREILQGRLRSRVNRRRKRLEEKLALLEADHQKVEEADRYRICGETLLTYAHQVDRGESEALLPHLYEPGRTLTIALDPALGAVDNAQKYFRRYRKITNSKKHLEKQIGAAEAELSYYRELLFTIEQGDKRSLGEIYEELVEVGLLKRRKKNRRENKRSKPQPLTFRGASGATYLVGRNNRQNDYVTFKLARRGDTWLHAQGIPGSHVIIKEGSDPPAESDLLEAALLAAYFSSSRELPAVAVDYTAVRHLRRAPGGKPGFVLYNRYKTITVDPRDEKVKELLEKR